MVQQVRGCIQIGGWTCPNICRKCTSRLMDWFRPVIAHWDAMLCTSQCISVWRYRGWVETCSYLLDLRILADPIACWICSYTLKLSADLILFATCWTIFRRCSGSHFSRLYSMMLSNYYGSGSDSIPTS